MYRVANGKRNRAIFRNFVNLLKNAQNRRFSIKEDTFREYLWLHYFQLQARVRISLKFLKGIGVEWGLKFYISSQDFEKNYTSKFKLFKLPTYYSIDDDRPLPYNIHMCVLSCSRISRVIRRHSSTVLVRRLCFIEFTYQMSSQKEIERR